MSATANHDWKSSLGYYFILFQALGTKSYEKGTSRVSFCLHLDFLNMNDTDLTFNGLVKLNTEKPSFGNELILSQVHETYENGLIR